MAIADSEEYRRIAQEWLAAQPVGTVVSHLAIGRAVNTDIPSLMVAHNFLISEEPLTWARYEKVKDSSPLMWKRTS